MHDQLAAGSPARAAGRPRPRRPALEALALIATLTGGVTGVRFLNGNNLGETRPFSTSAITGRAPSAGRGPIATAADFREHFRALLGEMYGRHDFERLVPVTDADAWDTTLRMSSLGLAGFEFHNSARSTTFNLLVGELLGRRQDCVSYTYLWSHMLPVLPEDRGTERDPAVVAAWHSSEMWFTFGSLSDGVPPWRHWRPEDHRLADRASTYWANFIASGDPNGEELPVWPASDADHGWMEFADDAEPHQGLGALEPLLVEFTRAEYGLKE
jgi:para-nitrobenzyl esterase